MTTDSVADSLAGQVAEMAIGEWGAITVRLTEAGEACRQWGAGYNVTDGDGVLALDVYPSRRLPTGLEQGARMPRVPRSRIHAVRPDHGVPVFYVDINLDGMWWQAAKYRLACIDTAIDYVLEATHAPTQLALYANVVCNRWPDKQLKVCTTDVAGIWVGDVKRSGFPNLVVKYDYSTNTARVDVCGKGSGGDRTIHYAKLGNAIEQALAEGDRLFTEGP